MTIYLDELFLKEMARDFFLIFIANKICKQEEKFLMMFLSCLIGAIYTIVCLLNPSRYILAMKPIITFLIVFVGISTKNIKSFFYNVLTYYLVSFLTSGVMFYTYGSKVRTYIYVAMLASIIACVVDSYINRYKIRSHICKIKIRNIDNIVALIDSGNNLKSFKKEEVIVLSPKIIKQLKDKEIYEILKNENINVIDKYTEKFRIINFKSLGNKCGVKCGIYQENIQIHYNSKNMTNTAVIVSAEENFDAYDAIVSLSFIKGGKEDGDTNVNKKKGNDAIRKVLNTTWN